MHRVTCWLALSQLLSVAMAQGTDAPPPAGPLAGFVRYEFNKWLFFPCTPTAARGGKTVGLPFIDATPRGGLFRAIQQRWEQAADPLRGIYLEFAGYEEDQRVTATELWRALGWVESCTKRPNNVSATALAWAAGNEPSWHLTVDRNVAVFTSPGEAPLRFASIDRRTDANTTIVLGQIDLTRLRGEFSADLCTDTMSEAAFGRRVIVAVNGRLYSGCGFVR